MPQNNKVLFNCMQLLTALVIWAILQQISLFQHCEKWSRKAFAFIHIKKSNTATYVKTHKYHLKCSLCMPRTVVSQLYAIVTHFGRAQKHMRRRHIMCCTAPALVILSDSPKMMFKERNYFQVINVLFFLSQRGKLLSSLPICPSSILIRE